MERDSFSNILSFFLSLPLSQTFVSYYERERGNAKGKKVAVARGRVL